MRAVVRAEFRVTEMSKEIGRLWKDLPTEEREVREQPLTWWKRPGLQGA